MNASERSLKALCDRTFLSLWGFSSLFREPGQELCDVLVVFGKHLIIFSDKDCQYPATGRDDVDWNRWFKRAIKKSAEQVVGAERWIRNFPDRVFLDAVCSQRLPLALPDPQELRIHRVVVAHGVKERCQKARGGSGSLHIRPSISGSQHFMDGGQGSPFVVGQVDPQRGFVHVIDDVSLHLLMTHLDTVTDFVNYLDRKERFITGGALKEAAGEEQLLGSYLSRVNEEDEHDFVFPGRREIVLPQGGWERYERSDQLKAKIEADQISYLWDHLIEKFSYHSVNRTFEFASDHELNSHEKALRFMACEPRLFRRMFSAALSQIITVTHPRQRHIRIAGLLREGPIYVFLAFPHEKQTGCDDYRAFRRFYLEAACRVAKLKCPDALDIVGIAMESGTSGEKSEDLLCLDLRDWNEEDQRVAVELQKKHGILTNETMHGRHVEEYPTTLSERFAHGVGEMKGRDRNRPCPCGSGSKFKKCHGK